VFFNFSANKIFNKPNFQELLLAGFGEKEYSLQLRSYDFDIIIEK